MENPNIIVTSGGENWNFSIEGARFVTAKEYLTDPEFADMHRARVFNLCRHYRYQSMGYYVSLLAEARQHHVLPSIRTIQDFRSQTMVRSITDDLDDLIQLEACRASRPPSSPSTSSSPRPCRAAAASWPAASTTSSPPRCCASSSSRSRSG
ncbi:MAG: RimK-like ATPgrasp N-terminal domain-containing protein [Kiritimatiellia bacterium]